jgi:hypothetical protein
LLALPSFTIFNNLILSVNSNKNVAVGDLKIDDSTNVSNLNANLRINYFSYDDYFVDKPSPYLSRGSLLKKMLWLNTLGSGRDVYLLFDQLVYKNSTFANQAFRIKCGQGYLKLSDLDLQSPTFDLKGNIEVDISNNSPKLNIEISSKNLQYNTTQTSANNDIASQFFDLPSLDEFSGKVNLNIGSLKINDWQGNDINIAGKLKSGIVNFDNFTLKTYQGTANYKGAMIFKNTKTVNGSLELVGVNNSQFLDDFFNIKNISGISNISATMNSSAENKAEFFKNLNAKAQFISGNVGVKGFGIYDLAVKLAQPQKYQTELATPENIVFAPNAQSLFKDAAGAVEIKKGNDKNLFQIKVGTLGINGVVSGNIDSNQSLNSNANFIFITGTRTKQIPINVIVNFIGKAGKIEQSTNFDQVRQYLDSVGNRQSAVGGQ